MEPFTIGGIEFTVEGVSAYIASAVSFGLVIGVTLVLFTLLYGRVR